MAGPDIVLFVVGFVLFGGATYAIVALDGDGGPASALGVFDVTYSLADVEVGSEAVASLRSATIDFPLNLTDVVLVRVLVECAGPSGDVGPVTFDLQVTVSGPNGLAGEGDGSCGDAPLIEVAVAAVPPDTSVPGRNEADARENLPRTANATRAVGTWTVGVSGARSGAPIGLPAGDPAGTVTLTAEQAQPVFAPVQR